MKRIMFSCMLLGARLTAFAQQSPFRYTEQDMRHARTTAVVLTLTIGIGLAFLVWFVAFLIQQWRRQKQKARQPSTARFSAPPHVRATSPS